MDLNSNSNLHVLYTIAQCTYTSKDNLLGVKKIDNVIPGSHIIGKNTSGFYFGSPISES